MAFAVGRVLSWGGFLGLFSIFVVERWLVGVMVRGGHAEEEKMSCGMTSMGTGTPEKENKRNSAAFRHSPKEK